MASRERERDDDIDDDDDDGRGGDDDELDDAHAVADAGGGVQGYGNEDGVCCFGGIKGW